MSGYGAEDHFLEGDTYLHCWEVVAALLQGPWTEGLLTDVGMPVQHRNVRYNCRVFLLDRKVLFIRPKLALADDGNYRESRWFAAWQHRFELQEYYLPRTIVEVTGQRTVPIGDGCLALDDTVLGVETCEELFTPDAPHVPLSLDGVEILVNGSGSHHELRKLHRRVELIRGATALCGGIYLYANQQCCDGGRLYYDGSALIACNGKVYGQGSQFGLSEVEVLVATLDLSDVRTYRGQIASRAQQAAHATPVPRVRVPFALGGNPAASPSRPLEVRYHTVEEEIGLGPACWLWDYLRRSGLRGFFLPLSGGADSAATAAIVAIMCKLVHRAVQEGVAGVEKDVRRILAQPEGALPATPQALAQRLFHTAYLASAHSGDETRLRAAKIAEQVGAAHHELQIGAVTQALEQAVRPLLPRAPRFAVHGGTAQENLALQNIQARSRMVLSYFLAQLLPWARGEPSTLLVLGSANVDEALRGYLTKYDCSAADLNPIGAVSKRDLKRFLLWAARDPWVNLPVLAEVAGAVPTAELEPRVDGYEQQDEKDMGCTYDELSVFGRLRKNEAAGPVAMYLKLRHEWAHLAPSEVARKVKHLFKYYAINRHKTTVLPPAYHAEAYSPDDNRYDLRPFLYNVNWTWQFRAMDKLVAEHEAALKAPAPTPAPAPAPAPEPSEAELQAELALAEQRVRDLAVKLALKQKKQ